MCSQKILCLPPVANTLRDLDMRFTWVRYGTVMRQFYFSNTQVKHDYSLLRAYAVSCGRFNITVNRDYLHAQNQGKLARVCLQQFSSIFETTILTLSLLYV